MRYIATVLLIVTLFAVAWIIEINQGLITINLTPSRTHEISKSSFFLISIATGAGLVFLVYLMRDIRRFLRGLKVQREQKKRSKIQELYARGLNALLAKRNPEAIAFFQRILNIDPNHVDTLLRMGITQLRQKDAQEAIRLHLKAWNLDQDNQEVMFSLAADYEEAKKPEDAIKMYQTILERDPTNITALMRLRDQYHRLGNWAELTEAQTRLLAAPLTASEQELEHRKLAGFRYELGRSLLESGELDKARKVFRTVIKMDRDFIPAYLGLGEVYHEEGKTTEAAELWEKAYKMTSSILLLLRLEDLYLKQGEPGKAIEIYKQALTWKPQDTTVKFFLGKLYYRLEMVDEAFDILSTVDWGDRDVSDVHKLLGNIYLRRGSLGLASAEFKKALGFRKQIIVPYTCGNCEHKTNDWAGRCPNCGKWNTFGVNLEKSC
ncbi:MAG: tetratricopeptide repeat protein [Nitrospirota bacterium]|nr:tetratricopeptide repeat protein [Nitrospirota bacterium]